MRRSVTRWSWAVKRLQQTAALMHRAAVNARAADEYACPSAAPNVPRAAAQRRSGRRGAKRSRRCCKRGPARRLGLQRADRAAVHDAAGVPTPKRSRARRCASIRSMRRPTICSARILSEQNDLPSGEWHFRRALELGGEQPMFLANLGSEPDAAGPHRRSREHFARADALAPGNCQNARALVEALRSPRRSAARQELLERARRRALGRRRRPAAGESSRAHRQAGEALAMLDDGAEAQWRCAARARPSARSRSGATTRHGRISSPARQLLAAEAGGLTYDAQRRRDVLRAAEALLRARATSRCCHARRARRTSRNRSSSWASRARAPR